MSEYLRLSQHDVPVPLGLPGCHGCLEPATWWVRGRGVVHHRREEVHVTEKRNSVALEAGNYPLRGHHKPVEILRPRKTRNALEQLGVSEPRNGQITTIKMPVSKRANCLLLRTRSIPRSLETLQIIQKPSPRTV